MTAIAIGVGLFPPLAGDTTPPVDYFYFRPGGVDRYLRPDGTSFYIRP